jgi:hypothetical protein
MAVIIFMIQAPRAGASKDIGLEPWTLGWWGKYPATVLLPLAVYYHVKNNGTILIYYIQNGTAHFKKMEY